MILQGGRINDRKLTISTFRRLKRKQLVIEQGQKKNLSGLGVRSLRSVNTALDVDAIHLYTLTLLSAV